MTYAEQIVKIIDDGCNPVQSGCNNSGPDQLELLNNLINKMIDEGFDPSPTNIRILAEGYPDDQVFSSFSSFRAVEAQIQWVFDGPPNDI